MPFGTPLRDFGRKPGPKPKSAKEQVAEKRLNQALDRAEASLSIGWKEQGGERIWSCPDTSIQLQAAKALLALAETACSYGKVVEKESAWRTRLKASFQDAASALEALLAETSGAPGVLTRAASACCLLTTSTPIWRDIGVPRLVAPLTRLLAVIEDSVASSAVSALLALLKGSYVSRKGLVWEQLKAGNVVSGVFKLLRSGTTAAKARALQLLSVLLQKYAHASGLFLQEARDLGELLARLCRRENEEVTKEALFCCAALAPDPEFASGLASDWPEFLTTLVGHLQESAVECCKENALLLLAALAPNLSLCKPSSSHLKAIAEASIAPLKQAITESQKDAQTDRLSLLASQAILALLQSPEPNFYLPLIKATFLKVLVALLSSNPNLKGEEQGYVNLNLRVVLWKVVARLGWLSPNKEVGHVILTSGLPQLVAAELGRVNLGKPKQEGLSYQELAELASAAFAFLASPSHKLQSATLDSTTRLVPEVYHWLGTLAQTLRPPMGGQPRPAQQALLGYTKLAAALGLVPPLKPALEETGVRAAVTELVLSQAWDTESSRSETWQGNSPVLLTALQALVALEVDKGKKEGEMTEVLSRLTSAKQSPGVRCWAARALVGLGSYGSPSQLGKDMAEALNDPQFADLVFTFPDGNRLYAHQAILAALCPTLLTAIANTKSTATSARSEPLEVKMSSRVNREVFGALLKFIYSGQVKKLEDPLRLQELAVLAKKCRLKRLVKLMQESYPVPGSAPDVLELTPALTSEDEGLSFSDVQVIVKGEGTDSNVVTFRAHRVVLAARSDYCKALLRSGMRDSLTGQITLPNISPGAAWALLKFLYSGHLSFAHPPTPQGGAPGNTPTWVVPAVELAELAGQWMLEELQELCWDYVLQELKKGQEVALLVLKSGAERSQWVLVEAAVEDLAPVYREVQEELRSVPEGLQEAVRSAHVRLLVEES